MDRREFEMNFPIFEKYLANYYFRKKRFYNNQHF